MNGTAANELLHGGSGNDTISGDGGIDLLYGAAGTDTINGGDGDDYLFGGAGNDVLNGGNGADFLRGDGGNDTMTGGAGADTFSIDIREQASNTITDFQVGTDKIVVEHAYGADTAALVATDHRRSDDRCQRQSGPAPGDGQRRDPGRHPCRPDHRGLAVRHTVSVGGARRRDCDHAAGCLGAEARFRQAGNIRLEGEHGAREGLGLQALGRQKLTRRRHEQRFQIGPAEAQAGRIGGRDRDDAIDLAKRRKPDHLAAGKDRIPDTAFGIDAGAVRALARGAMIDENAAVGQGAVRDIEIERPSHEPARIGEIERALIG